MRAKSMPPHPLLDYIKVQNFFQTDAQLARALGVTMPCISKIRHKVNPFSSNLLIKVHEITGTPINKLKEYLVDHG